MKLKAIIKALLPYIVGTILTVAVINLCYFNFPQLPISCCGFGLNRITTYQKQIDVGTTTQMSSLTVWRMLKVTYEISKST